MATEKQIITNPKYEKVDLEAQKSGEVIEVDIAEEAIELVRREKTTYEYPYIFVTRKVAFNVRFLIEQLRKNYWGVFDKKFDPVSNKELTWVPLTEWITDTHVANTRLSTNNFKFRANTDAGIGFVNLVRHLVHNWMNKEVFGEDLEKFERQLAIDGSAVLKTWEGIDENGKTVIEREPVDLLNIYFDFTNKSIQKAYRFTERSIMTKDECVQMDGWINTDKIKAVTGLHPIDPWLSNVVLSTNKAIDVWELWGKIPYGLITGKKEDMEKEVDGHIVCSGLQYKGKELIHLIETNPGGKKPYEEAHTTKVPGRWLGRGPAEKVMMMQSWINMIVNIRKLRNQVAQLGIFKVKKGTPISPQILSRQAANGVITVNNMDDIEQMVMQEAGAGSYTDENTVVGWARRVSSAYQAVTGEMPVGASKSQVAIYKMEQMAAEASFQMFSDSIGFFLQRWMKHHAFPILMKTLDAGMILNLTCEPDELEVFDDQIVNYYAYQKLQEIEKNGKFVDMNVVTREINNAKTKLRKLGRQRFVKMIDLIDFADYEMTFYTNAENFDEKATVDSLVQALQIAPEYRSVILPELFDTLGLDSTKLHEYNQRLQTMSQINPGQDPNQNNNNGQIPASAPAMAVGGGKVGIYK